MKKKVLFIIPKLTIGGAQKVLSIILNHLDRERFDLILCMLEGKGEYISNLAGDIHVIDLGCKRASRSCFKIIEVIKEIQPDIVFSGLSHVNMIVALCKPFVSKRIKFVARETNIPSINNRQNGFYRLFDFLNKRLYPRYTKIICQSQDMRMDLLNNYNIPEDRLVVINNPIEINKNKILAQNSRRLFDAEKINLLAAGKLKYQKGFDLLLQVLAKLNNDKYFLTILGKGELETQLKRQAASLNIAHQINFAGEVDNPLPYMQQADMFVLSSRFEGFSNVVLEALSVGTPVIAFNCKGGIDEIIIEGINGVLIDQEDIDAMVCAISSPKRFSKEAIVKSVAHLDISVIKQSYQDLLTAVE